ncbi:MAG: DNA repair protein RecO [Pseudomonadota bacterium]
MPQKIDMQVGWLLHSRPYRDTSMLLDFFTEESGRVSAIARGIRNPKAKHKALLQPFVPLYISLAGRGELQNLRDVETRGPALFLKGECLFSALYVNELMVRLVAGHEKDKELFAAYSSVLEQLSSGTDIEPLLRYFELCLLENLGYGLQLSHEADSDNPVVAEGWYYLQTDGGFIRQLQVTEVETDSAAGSLYSGIELQNISRADFSQPNTRRVAKRLLRCVLQQHLSERPLGSRELFRAVPKQLPPDLQAR